MWGYSGWTQMFHPPDALRSMPIVATGTIGGPGVAGVAAWVAGTSSGSISVQAKHGEVVVCNDSTKKNILLMSGKKGNLSMFFPTQTTWFILFPLHSPDQCMGQTRLFTTVRLHLSFSSYGNPWMDSGTSPELVAQCSRRGSEHSRLRSSGKARLVSNTNNSWLWVKT